MRGLCLRRRGRHPVFGLVVTLCVTMFVLTFKDRDLGITQFVIDTVVNGNLDIFSWVQHNATFCGGNYTGYGNKFFRLKSAIYTPKDDSFAIDCFKDQIERNSYKFIYTGGYSLHKYSYSLQPKDKSISDAAVRVNSESPTIAIYREHSHNFYHAMTQWYGVFLIAKVFGYKFSNLNILVVDRVAYNQIDDHWKTLFNNFTRTQDLSNSVLYDDAIFSFSGPESPMNKFHQVQLAYINEFSTMFLNRFGIFERKQLDCSKLVVVLSLRHDYIFHPEVDPINKRNAERKFKNEQELILTLEEEFKGHTVKTILAEKVPLVDQLRLATNTDVMISMHGCTLTHTLFLPKHAAIFELYPKYWEFQDFYRTMARWSKIRYDRWRNEDKNNEFPDHYTRVPPEVFRDYARRIKQYLGCTR